MFGNSKTKEEKQIEKDAKREAKIQKMLAQYGMQGLNNQEDIISIQKIAAELSGTGMYELGTTLGGGNDRDLQKLQMYYLRAIVEENFIIIRQLDRISKKLDK